jgi:hypothetical protein
MSDKTNSPPPAEPANLAKIGRRAALKRIALAGVGVVTGALIAPREALAGYGVSGDYLDRNGYGVSGDYSDGGYGVSGDYSDSGGYGVSGDYSDSGGYGVSGDYSDSNGYGVSGDYSDTNSRP